VQKDELLASQTKELTSLLRTSEDAFWNRLRDLLRTRGVDPNESTLVECFPDDNSFEFGILIAPDGRVIQFGFDYLHRPIDEGQLSEWEDLTDRWPDSPYRESVGAAIELRRSGTKFGPG